MLAGMASVSNEELAAAVTNAGGLGVVGGAFIEPDKVDDRGAPTPASRGTLTEGRSAHELSGARSRARVCTAAPKDDPRA